MAPVSRISELSGIIADSTAKLDAYHEAHNLPTPSFASDALPKYPYPSDIAQIRQAAVEATDELQALLAGPVETWVKPHVSNTFSIPKAIRCH